MKVVLALLTLLALAACSSSNGSECGEPSYDGMASDEAWQVIVDAESIVKVGDPNASTMGTPSEGQAFPASGAAPTLEWTSPLNASLEPRGPTRPAKSALARAGAAIEGLFIGTAWAHLPPVTGVIHSLAIDLPGRECPLAILTTEDSYALSPTQWDLLKMTAGETLSLEITSAYLRENRITEGPFRPAAARTFTVTP